MGIYGALATAVSGLRAQAFALENISGNIANSQTTGYKRLDTSFIDLIPDAAVGRQAPGAVRAVSRSTTEARGDILNSPTGTHIALNGSGFFVVAERSGTTDGRALFSETNYFTRRGDFALDREGYLVNGAGYYLKGVPVNPDSGNVAGSVPGLIQVGNGLLPAKATTRVPYELNLPVIPRTAAYDGVDPATALLTADPATGGELFLEQTIEGGAVTVFSADGAAETLQFRWGKTHNADAGVPQQDTWQLFYLADAASGRYEAAGPAYTFEGGKPTSGHTTVTLPGLTLNGVPIGTVTLDNGTGVTQYDNSNGAAQVSAISQNGHSAASFQSIEINDAGRVVVTYSNGRQIETHHVVTAEFNAQNMLKRLDGGVYAATAQSGEAIFNLEGSITGSALEASNTDISEEFTKLIVTQQAYAAGTRIVSTSDEMMREALNMVR